MKIISKWIYAASILGLAAATGCIGGGGEPLSEQTASTVMASVAANVVANLPTSNTASLPTNLAGGGVSLSSKKVKTLAAACESISPSTLVDNDNDGIAEEKTYTFDCTDEVSGSVSYTRQGDLSIRDKDDTEAGLLGGLEVEFNVTKFQSEDEDGNIYNYTFEGMWDYALENGSLVSNSDFTGRFYVEPGTSDLIIDYSYSYTWDYKMTPDDESNFFTSGSIEYSGVFTMDGQFYTEDSSGHHNAYRGMWSISYYSKDLTYDNTCSKYYRTGSLVMGDGSGSTYEIRYECSTAKFYINGVESDLYTP